nr:MAG TPA: hypothetical protein [Myoviridae sp. ctGMm2]
MARLPETQISKASQVFTERKRNFNEVKTTATYFQVASIYIASAIAGNYNRHCRCTVGLVILRRNPYLACHLKSLSERKKHEQPNHPHLRCCL